MRIAVALACLLPIPLAGASASSAVHVAGSERPPILDALGALESPTAIAIAPDGRAAALGLADPRRTSRGIVRLVSLDAGEPVASRAAGVVIDLLWVDDGARLLGLLNRPSRHGVGTTDLVEVDLSDATVRRLVRVAASARSLDRLPGSDVLLIAARDAVRTLLLPDLHSGPLYRVPGNNRSLTTLGGTRVLLGRPDEVILVDLDDPPGEDGLAPRESAAVPAPVAGLSAAADGILGRLVDGRIVSIRTAPLRVEDAGRSGWLASRSSTQLAESALPRGLRVPDPGPPSPPPPPDPLTATRPGRSPTPPDAAPDAGSDVTDEVRTPQTTPDIAPAVSDEIDTPEAVPEAIPDPVGTPPPPEGLIAPAVTGIVEGAAVEAVAAIVLFGPDNLLREAARVQPRAGRWSAGSLAPGRYRVQIDGGSNRVIISEPPFALVDVRDGEIAEAPPLRALRVL